MCTRPISVPIKIAGVVDHYEQVACGCCEECLNGKSIEYVELMYLESLYRRDVHFVTLTYSDEFLPFQVDHASIVHGYNDRRHRADIVEEVGVCPSLRRKDVISSLKRFRELEHVDFSYSFIGEYGKLGRPHYHGLLFGLTDKEVQVFLKQYWFRGFYDWKRIPLVGVDGRSDISAVTLYVSKYMRKGSFEKDEVNNGVCEKPRPFSSVGIGRHQLSRLRSWYLCEDIFGLVDIDKLPFPPAFVESVERRCQRFVIGNKVFPLCKALRNEFFYITKTDPLTLRSSRKGTELSKCLANRLSLRLNGEFEAELSKIASISSEDQRFSALQATLRSHSEVLGNREEYSKSLHKEYLRKSRVS